MEFHPMHMKLTVLKYYSSYHYLPYSHFVLYYHQKFSVPNFFRLPLYFHTTPPLGPRGFSFFLTLSSQQTLVSFCKVMFNKNTMNTLTVNLKRHETRFV
jgi:hypothetical protein